MASCNLFLEQNVEECFVMDDPLRKQQDEGCGMRRRKPVPLKAGLYAALKRRSSTMLRRLMADLQIRYQIKIKVKGSGRSARST
jgi:hypothetical protein